MTEPAQGDDLGEMPRERRKAWSDETLADKVRSEVFRDPMLPKGAVNLNVEAGRVVLRGEVAEPALVKELERRVVVWWASVRWRTCCTRRVPTRRSTSPGRVEAEAPPR